VSAVKRVWALCCYEPGEQSFVVRKHWEREPSLVQVASCFPSAEAAQEAGFGTAVARIWAGWEENIGDIRYFLTVIDDDDDEWALICL
jgi:hypothetical protein